MCPVEASRAVVLRVVEVRDSQPGKPLVLLVEDMLRPWPEAESNDRARQEGLDVLAGAECGLGGLF
jgi:hypothetical protein